MKLCTTFCRTLHTETVADLKSDVPSADIKAAWAYKYPNDRAEFHGPNCYYWYGRACCLWAARVHGWRGYIGSQNFEEEQ